MKQIRKKLTALLLAALMTVGMLPAAAAADTADEDCGIAAAAQAASQETLTITQTEPEISLQSADTTDLALSGTEYYSEAYNVLALVNAQRKAAGLSTLTMDQSLMNAAMQRAAECAVQFSHTRPDGTDCFSVLSEYGVSCSMAGENIAYGYTSADAVMDAWMNSSGHRANILNTGFQAIGIGCFAQPDGTVMWVQLFSDQVQQTAVQPADGTAIRTVRALTSQLGQLKLSLSATTLDFGEDSKIIAYFTNSSSIPAILDASCLSYSSSNPSVASVSSDGTVTAGSTAGTADITVSLRNNTAFSAAKTVTVKNQFSSQRPDGLTASNKSAGIRIKWNSVSDAQKYRIYRKAGSGSYKKVGETTKTSWTDKSTKNGTKYRYKIYAVRDGVRSKASASVTMYRLTAIRLTSVTSPTSGEIWLQWTQNSKATGYYVERTDTKTGDVDLFFLTGSGTTKGRITSCTSGRKYRVRMYAYRQVGNTIYEGVKTARQTITAK